MEKYTVGIDFGTLSGRALLVRVSDGAEIASASLDYPHGVMDTVLTTPDGELRLPPNWALAHPMDWLEVLGTVVRQVLAS
ncbi:MAG: ribulokinase, partial [Clostridia bacterium]|nr:ribulokinase [Clostridia bacterium]